jgi:cholesterol oxidase
MMMDDHEIKDNWEPPDSEKLCRAGKCYYFKFQQSRADSASYPNCVSFSFEHKGFQFFMGDTRTERQGRTALNFHKKRIMSRRQFRSLCRWLNIRPDEPRFVITPTAFFPRRLAVSRDPTCALQSDAWDGFPRSLHQLLKIMCERQQKGVVFLSGDEHRSSLSTIDVERVDGTKSCRLYSIHSSALYAPYPFANGTQANFNHDDTFLFPDAQKGPYRCRANTIFASPGDGFAIITARKAAGWLGTVEFHDSKGPKPDGLKSFAL